MSRSTNLDPADTDTDYDIYVKDLVSGELTLASVSDAGVDGNNRSEAPSLSGDKPRSFQSEATNLHAKDTDNGSDVYVKNLVNGHLRLASTSDAGVKGNAASLIPELAVDGTNRVRVPNRGHQPGPRRQRRRDQGLGHR